jgi:hypothetical protein
MNIHSPVICLSTAWPHQNVIGGPTTAIVRPQNRPYTLDAAMTSSLTANHSRGFVGVENLRYKRT